MNADGVPWLQRSKRHGADGRIRLPRSDFINSGVCQSGSDQQKEYDKNNTVQSKHKEFLQGTSEGGNCTNVGFDERPGPLSPAKNTKYTIGLGHACLSDTTKPWDRLKQPAKSAA